MYNSAKIKIGNTFLGGSSKVRIQSMTNTSTMDILATVCQVSDLVASGCDLVRITTQNIQEAKNLEAIKTELAILGIEVPLIADVHFNPKVAEIAAAIVDKVRINPGNYTESAELIEKYLIPLIKICKREDTAIRIGVNHGSISERMLNRYGNTPLGLVESLIEFVRVCNNNNFHKLVLSIKASNVITMIEANKLLVKKLEDEGFNYPIHVGVTEAGNDDEGRIKSATGIGYLLSHGIGDTIRVSLTEDPLAEIPVAKELINTYGLRSKNLDGVSPNVIQFPSRYFSSRSPFVVTSGFSEHADLSIMEIDLIAEKGKEKEYCNIEKLVYSGIPKEKLQIIAATDTAISLLDNNSDGIWLSNNGLTGENQNSKLLLQIFQALGKRNSSTEIIACPTCGRASINLIEILTDVKSQIPHIPGLKIAVMGCIVNGPGEMADADYGILGSGKDRVKIYKGKDEIVSTTVNKATFTLISIIRENGDWVDL